LQRALRRSQIIAGEAWDRARKDCTRDDDCTLASKRGCLSDCAGFPIAKASFAEWKQAHDKLESTICRKYVDSDCLAKAPQAVPSCPAWRAACDRGRCVAK
jgi:hypothetical protein